MPKNWADVVILIVQAALLAAMAVEIARSLRLVVKARRLRIRQKNRTVGQLNIPRLKRLKLRRNQLNKRKGGKVGRTCNQEERVIVMSELQDQTGG